MRALTCEIAVGPPNASVLCPVRTSVALRHQEGHDARVASVWIWDRNGIGSCHTRLRALSEVAVPLRGLLRLACTALGRLDVTARLVVANAQVGAADD